MVETFVSQRARQSSAPQALFGVSVIWSACLLFVVEPLDSKLILPWFGGSSAVWITCLLFFQAALLAGYLYAHASTRFLSPRTQGTLHCVLLAVSLLSLPIFPNARWQPPAGHDPTASLLLVLATSVGPPFMLLSSTSPLLQSWFARSTGVSGVPYRYFALSNGGSLLALLSYPVLVEPLLRAHAQAWFWSLGYFVFCLLCARVAWPARSGQWRDSVEPGQESSHHKWPLWVALSAWPSALLLATTSLLTDNIAPMPLLWVLPLGVYLLTFILCFESERWYWRPYSSRCCFPR